MTPTKLSAKLSIGPEPTADDLAALAAAGFRSVINNRTDKEDELRLNSDQMALAVEAQSMGYAHIPVVGKNPLERDAQAFEDALEEMPGPIYAYCKTGGRSAALWALASVVDADIGELIAKCAAAGHDISGLKAKMEMRREMLLDEEDDD
jgi:sulfide:quinone oxidoreductase